MTSFLIVSQRRRHGKRLERECGAGLTSSRMAPEGTCVMKETSRHRGRSNLYPLNSLVWWGLVFFNLLLTSRLIWWGVDWFVGRREVAPILRIVLRLVVVACISLVLIIWCMAARAGRVQLVTRPDASSQVGISSVIVISVLVLAYLLLELFV
jgi:hypothetical protein